LPLADAHEVEDHEERFGVLRAVLLAEHAAHGRLVDGRVPVCAEVHADGSERRSGQCFLDVVRGHHFLAGAAEDRDVLDGVGGLDHHAVAAVVLGLREVLGAQHVVAGAQLLLHLVQLDGLVYDVGLSHGAPPTTAAGMQMGEATSSALPFQGMCPHRRTTRRCSPTGHGIRRTLASYSSVLVSLAGRLLRTVSPPTFEAMRPDMKSVTIWPIHSLRGTMPLR